jgi:hypothetical protein
MKTIAFMLLCVLSACGGSASAPNSQTNMRDIHATTIYIIGNTLGTPGLPLYLSTNISTIKDIGFNAVYLPTLWKNFDPNPLNSPRVYDENAFAQTRAVLDFLRSNGLKVLVGLNYVGPGYAPNFGAVLPDAQACDWARTPAIYAAFEQYVQQFLTELASYNDMLSLMVFTESAEGCGLATEAAAPAVAAQLQTTLGSMPSRLPPALRSQWKIGYHDYSIVNLGWGNGVGPIALPNEFDFVSMVAYNVATTSELDTRASRFSTLYPNSPLIVGESGAAACPPPATNETQTTLDVQTILWALNRGFGFNLWGWPNAGAAECTNPVYGGLALTDTNGVPNQAANSVKRLLTGN